MVNFSGIDSSQHDIRPALQTSNNKKGHHCLENIVEIGILYDPGTTSDIAFIFVVVLVYIMCAIEELASKNINRKNGEHEPHGNHNDNNIENGTD